MVENFFKQRKQLISQMKADGVLKSPFVENAFSAIKREDFMPAMDRDRAYQDDAFPIGHGQTISQPSTIAKMLELLDVKPTQTVLEVGSGSGYVLALLSCLTQQKNTVYGIELMPALSARARIALDRQQLSDVQIKTGNGIFGWPEVAPFDRILISAASDTVPPQLIKQLKEGGKLVAPLGKTTLRELVAFQKKNGKLEQTEKHGTYLFVPLQE